jgi:hypothetical protein
MTSFGCKIASPKISCQILVAFKIHAMPVFSEITYKLNLSFPQLKIL